MRINRLARWSVYRQQLGIINFGPTIFTQTAEERFACRVELDINTAAEYTEELPLHKFPHLLDELIDYGGEIAEKGSLYDA